ncbi:MAG: peptidylprolyl isomerase [Candidatus Micrarchaeota archaeon]|nr:peptidylprolyl isomerase [Candidatus Micrarchaeota archaeon]
MSKQQVYTVDYEGRLEDGTIFDKSREGQPLTFISGMGMVIPGFESGIIGMEKGEQKEIRIEPEDAYGPYRKELVMELPRSVLEGLPNVKEGMEIVATLESGQQVPVKIVKLLADKVMLDFNHPLAGKVLIFKIRVVGKRDATKDDFGPCGGECDSCGCTCGH